MKIISVIGARPQFIKAAPLSKELRIGHSEILVHTGQHYDKEMSDVFFEELNIKPDYYLNVGSGTQGYQTGEMLKRIETVLLKEKPEFVIVYGDTNSTLAGALAASKLNIPISHIEAGLRSFNKLMPEEINRIMTDHISSLLFCPTQTAVNNLRNENVIQNVYLVGDIMFDATLQALKTVEKDMKIMEQLNLSKQKYYLMTIHRASNTNNKKILQNIIDSVSELDEKIVFPIHPRTEKCLIKFNLYNKLAKKIIIIKPVGYFDMLILEKNAKKIITDSGGIQKEAYFLKVPCVTLRDETEWIETVEDNWNLLLQPNSNNIAQSIKCFNPCNEQKNHFGDGNSAKKIVDILNCLG